jgi:hypothetical protein
LWSSLTDVLVLDVASGLAFKFRLSVSFLGEMLDEHFLREDRGFSERLRKKKSSEGKKTTYSGQGDDKGGVVGAHLDIWVLADDFLDS